MNISVRRVSILSGAHYLDIENGFIDYHVPDSLFMPTSRLISAIIGFQEVIANMDISVNTIDIHIKKQESSVEFQRSWRLVQNSLMKSFCLNIRQIT